MALHIFLSCCFGFPSSVGGFDVSSIKKCTSSWPFQFISIKSFIQIHINWNGIRKKTNYVSVMKSCPSFHSFFFVMLQLWINWRITFSLIEFFSLGRFSDLIGRALWGKKLPSWYSKKLALGSIWQQKNWSESLKFKDKMVKSGIMMKL